MAYIMSSIGDMGQSIQGTYKRHEPIELKVCQYACILLYLESCAYACAGTQARKARTKCQK